MNLVCNPAVLLTLNGGIMLRRILVNWWQALGIGLQLARIASFVVTAVLRTLGAVARDLFVYIN
jgi:hypothetical protein